MDEDLHGCIIIAAHAAGLKHSIPTSLLMIMKSQMCLRCTASDDKDSSVVNALNTEHIKSHLQKYRLRAQVPTFSSRNSPQSNLLLFSLSSLCAHMCF
jgi:hypothetical protein